MVLSRTDLWDRLKRREFAPVYVFFGPETYLRDVAVKTVSDRLFDEGDFRDFNENCFSLNVSDNLENALAVARQLPMMAKHRVVQVTDVRVSATGHRDTVLEDHEPILSAYCADPCPTSTVIFLADDLNGNRKMGKFLRNNAAAVEFSPLDDHELEKLALDGFKKAGAEIDRRTLQEFVSRIGPDVRRLNNEISKVATAALPSSLVTLELVEQLVPRSRTLDHFDLTKYLVAGKRTAAMEVLEKILSDGAEPVALLGMISYNYRRLMIAKDMMDRGVDRREVAGILKMRYNDQEPFLATARRVEMKKLTAAIKRLAQTDVAIKTSIGGGGPDGSRMQIEMLVCELVLL